MVLSLPASLEALIRSKVESGQYDSPAQVVEEAMLLLEEHDQLRQLRLERMRRELADGVFQANSRNLVGREQVFAGLSRQADNAIE